MVYTTPGGELIDLMRVDLVRVDLVRIDLVAIDLMRVNLVKGSPNKIKITQVCH